MHIYVCKLINSLLKKKAATAAKLKAEASIAKNKLKINPKSKTEDKTQINKSIKLNKGNDVSSLNIDSSGDTEDDTSSIENEKIRKEDSSKNDSKSKNSFDGNGT